MFPHSVPCQAGYEWSACAFTCDQVCDFLARTSGACDGSSPDRCVAGCRPQDKKDVCPAGQRLRDFNTCVPSEMCTCLHPNGSVAQVCCYPPCPPLLSLSSLLSFSSLFSLPSPSLHPCLWYPTFYPDAVVVNRFMFHVLILVKKKKMHKFEKFQFPAYLGKICVRVCVCVGDVLMSCFKRFCLPCCCLAASFIMCLYFFRKEGVSISYIKR